MLITLMFSVVDKKSRTFSSPPCSANEQCAGAGREHSQAASPSCPVEIFHTMDIRLSLLMGIGRGGRNQLF